MYRVRGAVPEEFSTIGKLLVEVYSSLEGFPKPSEQSAYYHMLQNVGELTQKPGVEILVAVDASETIGGAVVYVGDMKHYGSGGTATQAKNASGFRLLAVNPAVRGKGIGKLLTNVCIEKSRALGQKELVIHTTMAMQTAWRMYESMGFRRSEDLDFTQGSLLVVGFRLAL